MIGVRDVQLKTERARELLLSKHESYLRQYASDDEGTEQIMGEYLKMSGMYWGLNALYLMNSIKLDDSVVSKVTQFIKSCQCIEGGFSAAPRHDPHILHTLSAVQLLIILGKCQTDYIDIDRCVDYVKSLQQADGSFFGDKWGEVDTRFSFCALATLRLLNRLDAIDIDKAVEFVLACNNQIDGGFGCKPGSESHSAYVYCCVGSLGIANQLHRFDKDQLGVWLSERQLPSGGLNGRPEKLPDLCYSWWCLSSLLMIGKMHMIDHKRLVEFIMACQDDEQGGFSDRPGNWVDPYHTMFGVASLSLIYHYYNNEESNSSCPSIDSTEIRSRLVHLEDKLKTVNPILCMPEECLSR